MSDTLSPSPVVAEAVKVTRATGFLVTLVCGDSYESFHVDDWREAIELYDEGFKLYRGLAITPTENGKPLGSFAPHTIVAMRADR